MCKIMVVNPECSENELKERVLVVKEILGNHFTIGEIVSLATFYPYSKVIRIHRQEARWQITDIKEKSHGCKGHGHYVYKIELCN